MSLAITILALVLSGPTGASLPDRWRDGYLPFSVPGVDSLAQDPRVVKAAAKWFPTYVAVRFSPLARDTAKNPEYLWVRILDLDAPSGIYLGELVEPPRHVVTVRRRDNVVFRFRTIMDTIPSALPVGGSYLAHPGAMTEFDKAFVEAVSAYREVEYGRNREALPDCYAKLKKAVSLGGSSGAPRDAYHARYLLGRCYSEGYEIDSAIAWYKAAMKIDSSNLDAPLSLMGDYTLRYAESLRARNVRAAMALKSDMQKLSDWIRKVDSPGGKASAMLDAVYDCQDKARAKRKDPCNMMRYRR